MLKTLKVTQKLHTTFKHTQPIDLIDNLINVIIEWGRIFIHIALRRFRQSVLFSTLTLIFVRQRTSALDSRLQAFFQCRC